MDNADLRALLLGAMKTAYEAGHHATVEGHYHEEWQDDHVDDWMDDEGITDPGYVRVPVEPTIEMIAALEFDGDIDLAIGHAQICEEIKERYRAMISLAATKETPND